MMDNKRFRKKIGDVFEVSTSKGLAYFQYTIDGTKPAGENRKTIRFPEGKKVTCYVGSDLWMRGKENGAAMYSEDIPNGKRYFCNDGEEDDDFDDIIFTVTRAAN